MEEKLDIDFDNLDDLSDDKLITALRELTSVQFSNSEELKKIEKIVNEFERRLRAKEKANEKLEGKISEITQQYLFTKSSGKSLSDLNKS